MNFISFTIIAISYFLMYTTAKSTQKAVRTRQENERTAKKNSDTDSTAMARRMTLIVASAAACWLPIIALGVASLLGMTIPPKVTLSK